MVRYIHIYIYAYVLYVYIYITNHDEPIASEELEQERHLRAAAEASWRQECDQTRQLREHCGKLQQQLRNAERHWVGDLGSEDIDDP